MINGKGRRKLNENEKYVLGLFGEKLKEILENANISQAELARDLGLSKTSVNTWVKGTKQPQFIQLREIIIYLLKSKRLIEFYPIDLLVPDISVKMSETENEISELKKQLMEEYKKYKDKNEKIEKQLMDEEELETEWEELEQEQGKLKKEKETYKEKLRLERFQNESKLKRWSPRAVADHVLKDMNVSNTISENNFSQIEMCDYITNHIAGAITIIIKNTFPMLDIKV